MPQVKSTRQSTLSRHYADIWLMAILPIRCYGIRALNPILTLYDTSTLIYNEWLVTKASELVNTLQTLAVISNTYSIPDQNSRLGSSLALRAELDGSV